MTFDQEEQLFIKKAMNKGQILTTPILTSCQNEEYYQVIKPIKTIYGEFPLIDRRHKWFTNFVWQRLIKVATNLFKCFVVCGSICAIYHLTGEFIRWI